MIPGFSNSGIPSKWVLVERGPLPDWSVFKSVGETQSWRVGMYKTLRGLNSREELRNEAKEAELEASRG